MIPLTKPIITQEMLNAAQDALKNEHLVLGESVFKFEEEFAKYIGTKYAVSTNSGTSALSLSILALKQHTWEHILTTPMSFIATSNAIKHANCEPKFVDVEAESGNIDLTKDIPKNIKGIIPVHLYGNPCNIDKLKEMKEKEIFVIEDACQAAGAEYKGQKMGSIGHCGCFSFYSTKNITVGGDGGMITTNDENIANKIRSLSDCGRISKYEHTSIGFTARLNTVNAAIGRVQLKYLDKWNQKRRNIANLYQKLLPKEILLKENGKSSYHIFAIKHKNRNIIQEHLSENNIQTGIHYPIPIHLQPIYKEIFNCRKGDYSIAETFSEQILSLPIYPKMKSDDAKFICEKILEVI